MNAEEVVDAVQESDASTSPESNEPDVFHNLLYFLAGGGSVGAAWGGRRVMKNG